MSSPACHIGQIRFELEVDAMAQGRAVLERVSQFGRQELASLLAGVLEAHANSEQLLVLERVELDLGEVAESQLERLLGQGIARCLREYLLRHAPLAPPEAPGAAGAGPARGPAWRAFCQFLAGAPLDQPDQVLDQLLREWPRELARQLRSEGRRQAVRQRLAQRLGTRLLEALLAVLEPGEAPLIARYVEQVCALHQRQPLVAENRRSFGAMLWEFVLAYLLLERGSHFNTKALAAHTIAQIARRYRVDYAALLAHMTHCIAQQDLPLLQRDGLQAILLELAAEQPGAAPPPAQLVPAHRRRLECIASYLEHGAWPERLVHGAEGGIGQLVQQALEQDQDLLLALLRRLGARQAVRQRLACQLPPEQRLALVHALEPVHGAWIGRTVHGIAEVQARRHVVHDDQARFGQRLWEFVFAALLQERGSWFNTRSFVRSLVARLAAHYNVRYQALLQGLLGAGLAQLPLARKHGLPAILVSLQQELAAPAAPAAPASAQGDPALLEKTVRGALLRHILGARAGTAGLRRLLAQALQAQARRGGDLARMAAALGAHGPQIERLLLQRDDLAAILAALAEEQAGADSAAASPAPPPAAPSFARAAREFVLRSFQVERGSYFNNRSYIKQLLHQLAARHGIAYAHLLHGLSAAAGGASAPAQTSLPAILLSLKAESAPPAPPAARPADRLAQADPGWRFVRDGELAAGAADTLLRDGIEGLDIAALARALRTTAQPDAMLERLIRYLPQPRLGLLAEALAPGASGLAASWRLCALGLAAATPLSSAQQAGLAALTWRAVLRVLLAQRGELSAAQFIGAAGAVLAPRLGLSLAALQAHLMAIAAARVGGQARYAVLLELLARSGARLAALPAAASPAAPAAPVPAPGAALLAAWLRYGMAGAAAIEPGIGEAALWLAIGQGLAASPEPARAAVLAAAGRALERERLAHLLPAPMRGAVLRLLAGAAAERLAWWHAALTRAAEAATAGGHWDARLFAVLLAACHRQRHGAGAPAAFVGAALDAVGTEDGVRQRMHALLIEQAGSGAEMHAVLARAAARARAKPVRDSAAPARAEAAAELPQGQRFPVGNAGLVILWPFLDHYFRLLGMQDDGAFIDAAARHRAAALLHYLSHGSMAADEPELLLNKLLCGIDPGTPVASGGPLSEAELAATGQLFAALSQAWKMVANTDADGLRSTFLRRAGTLERGEQQWTLNVPREPFDVLLSGLPWALGTIRLSWMQTLLTVSWT